MFRAEKISTARKRAVAFTSAALISLSTLPSSALSAERQELAFKLLYAGIPVGAYRVSTRSERGETVIESLMNIEVKVGPMSLHRFDQVARETWRNGQLITLGARTVENDETTSVIARRQGRRTRIEGPDGVVTAEGSLGTLSALVLGEIRDQVVDPKRGTVRAIEVSKPVATEFRATAEGDPVWRYRVTGGISADVWASPRGVERMIVGSKRGDIEFLRAGSNLVRATSQRRQYGLLERDPGPSGRAGPPIGR
jgi:hypothetical protein